MVKGFDSSMKAPFIANDTVGATHSTNSGFLSPLRKPKIYNVWLSLQNQELNGDLSHLPFLHLSALQFQYDQELETTFCCK